MTLTRLVRSALALAALSSSGVRAEQKKWEVSCTGGTLQVNEVAGNTLTALCSADSDPESISYVATDGIDLVINDVSATLTVTFESIGDLQSLSVTAGNGTMAPTVTVSGGLASPTSFYSLSLDGVNFEDTDATLSIANTVNYLSVVGSNAKNIGIPTTTPLRNLTLGGSFSVIPRILYDADYNTVNGGKGFLFSPADSFSLNISATQLTETQGQNLIENVESLATIGVECTKTDGNPYNCDAYDSSSSKSSGSESRDATSVNSPFPSSSKHTSGSSSSDSSASVGNDDGGSDGLSTVLIVVIVIVALVALVLLFFIVRHCRSRRAASNGSGADDNTVTLMAKAETPGGGNNVKSSFISSDEFLRTFRVEQSDVSLTKSLGTGRLWMGEYQNNKVVIKRVEAEVTESFVTKELMNQARTLASLSHPSIVSLVGVTWLAGTDFAVIAEFMAKGNLKNVLVNLDVELDLAAKLQVCLEVAQGLAYLHDPERNMCMKTLSSRKVLVNSTMGCKLNLFECVSAGVKIDRSTSSFPFGTGEIAWLAPEVITRSAPMDARKANIYSFGVLVGEILTRSSPYQTLVDELGNTLSDVEIVSRVKNRRPLCPHELRHEYVRAPPSLRELVEACLSYDTMGRPSAEQLVAAVERAMEEARTNSI